ncbi:MAG: hypothetical protein OXI18_07135, partial [bacterium]|nr:hypothetical protein [bacterium]
AEKQKTTTNSLRETQGESTSAGAYGSPTLHPPSSGYGPNCKTGWLKSANTASPRPTLKHRPQPLRQRCSGTTNSRLAVTSLSLK